MVWVQIEFKYQVQIPVGEHTELKFYTCKFFNQKNTPCKHILYVYLNVLNDCESSHLLQQVYLIKNELVNIFHQKVPVSNKNIKLTNRAILQSISTVTRMAVAPQENVVPLNQPLPVNQSLPEP